MDGARVARTHQKNASWKLALRREGFVSGAVPGAGAGFFARGEREAARHGRLAARPFDRAHDPIARRGRERQKTSRGGLEREAVLVLAAGGKRPERRNTTPFSFSAVASYQRAGGL